MSKTIKKLYEFTLDKEELVNEETQTTAEDGSITKVTRPVKKLVPHSFFLLNPSRSLRDEAQLFNGVEIAKGIKAGLLSIAQLDKRNSDDGGIFGEKDKAAQAELINKLEAAQKQLKESDTVPAEQRTPEQSTARETLIGDITDIATKIREYNAYRESIYQHTAEFQAREKVSVWWLLNMSYKSENGKESPIFGTGSYDSKMDKYDEYMEGPDTFVKEVISKFITYVVLWNNYGVTKSEEFDRFEKNIKEQSVQPIKSE